MPIGENTLEANDERVLKEANPYQKHLSEWSVKEWKDLGYDVELFEGFHQSGKLDAAWLIKDFVDGKEFMKKCKKCGQKFKSSYYLGRHHFKHGPPEIKRLNSQSVQTRKLMARFRLRQRIDLSVNTLNFRDADIIEMPYEQSHDIARIISEAYPGIIIDQEIFENT